MWRYYNLCKHPCFFAFVFSLNPVRWSPLFSKSAALGLILAKHYCLKAIPILMADRIVENWGYRVVTKIIKLQKRIKHKVKGSKRLLKAYKTLAKLQKKKADIRRDFIQKLSTQIVNNHDIVIVEDLKITNMTKSAKGTVEAPGKNVKQKSGLNRAILSECWAYFFKCLEYKLENKGGVFKKVSPKHTSQKCSCCGHISKDNRKTQANFKCVKCGYENNADENASVNIAQAGHAWIARLANKQEAKASK